MVEFACVRVGLTDETLTFLFEHFVEIIHIGAHLGNSTLSKVQVYSNSLPYPTSSSPVG